MTPQEIYKREYRRNMAVFGRALSAVAIFGYTWLFGYGLHRGGSIYTWLNSTFIILFAVMLILFNNRLARYEREEKN